jgi:hypothetical protein
MPPKGDLDTLARCMREAHRDPVAMAECERKFTGTVEPDGGKVFSNGTDTEVFVTTGGKVFKDKP